MPQLSDAKNSTAPPITQVDLGTANSLRWTEKVAYGLGDTASNFYWKFFEYFLLYFYTDVFGISSRAAGNMLLITKIWDAINDPVFGYLADRTKSSWGRFRPYIFWGSVPLAITAMCTFFVPDLSLSGKLVYAYITYTLVMMAYTAVNIPYGALMGVITPNSLERTSVSTYRFVLAFTGGILIQTLTLPLVRWFGYTGMVNATGEPIVNQAAGFFWTMAVFAIASVALFLITFATCRERVQPIAQSPTSFREDFRFLITSIKLHQIALLGVLFLIALSTGFSPRVWPWLLLTYGLLSALSFLIAFINGSRAQPQDDLASTLELDFNDLSRNVPWLVLFGFGLFQLMAAFVRGGALLYYFTYYIGDKSYVSLFLVTGSVAAISGMMLTRPLTNWLGKKHLMIFMNVITAVCTALFFFVSPQQIYLLFVLQALGSFCSGPSPVLLWAMYADVADYSEWRFKRRATGLIFSAATFSQKFGVALGAAFAGWALDWIGYQPPVDGVEMAQSDFTLIGLNVLISLVPAGLMLAAAATLLAYPINQTLLQEIATDLHQRNSAEENRLTS